MASIKLGVLACSVWGAGGFVLPLAGPNGPARIQTGRSLLSLWTERFGRRRCLQLFVFTRSTLGFGRGRFDVSSSWARSYPTRRWLDSPAFLILRPFRIQRGAEGFVFPLSGPNGPARIQTGRSLLSLWTERFGRRRCLQQYIFCFVAKDLVR